MDVDALVAANPFPGLRSFEPEEADRFFGRRQQIDALVLRLAQVPLLAVSGASGCGKSSLVKAGLLSELKRRHLEEDETDWRTLVMRPGSRPIANLAAALARALGDVDADAAAASVAAPTAEHELSPLERRTASLLGQLRQGGLALVEIVRRAKLGPGVRLLVVVDQFEEIFRLKRLADAEEAAAFVKLLLQSAFEPGSRISVILTMRSDTLGGCADFEGLPEAVGAGGYLVPQLTRAQRKEAIVGPVRLRGHDVAPRLVQRLLADVSSDFDDLPVMQHALSRTWAHWARKCAGTRPIDLEDYEAEEVGGAAWALSRHADEAWADLEPGRQPRGTVEHVFRALTERVAGGIELRRPVELRELCAICDDGSPGARDRVRRVVDRFRRADTAFLVPAGDAPLADDAVIDISHESLIRQWESLRGWLEQEAESGRIYERLSTTAALNARGKARRWRQPDLGVALAWRQAEKPNAAWARRYGGDFEQAMNFLDDSNEEEVAGTTARRRRLRRWMAAGVACFVVAVAGALGWAVREYERVETSERTLTNTLDSYRFFLQLQQAVVARQQTGGDVDESVQQHCSNASGHIAGQMWRVRQWLVICGDEAGPQQVLEEERRRLEVNALIGQGDVAAALDRLKDLRGDSAARVLLNLQRLADLDYVGLRKEAQALALLAAGASSSAPGREACDGRYDELRHPIHRAVATTLCNGGEPTASQQKLLKTYAAQRDGVAARLLGRDPAEAKDYFDIRSEPVVTLRNDEWVYARLAKNALRPATLVDRARGLLDNASRWALELALLAVPAGWALWRWLQQSRGVAIPARAWPARRAAADLADCVIATVLLLLGLNMLTQLATALDLSSALEMIDGPLFLLVLLLLVPGFAYLVLADAVHLRYQRSLGKALFDLRPVRTGGDARGEIGLLASARRNLPLLPLFFCVFGAGLTTALAGDPIMLRVVLPPAWLALTAWIFLLRGRTLGDRWSGTQVIDGDSEESHAIDTPPRYLPRRPAARPMAAAAASTGPADTTSVAGAARALSAASASGATGSVPG